MISAKDAMRQGKQNPHDRWVGVEGAARDRIAARIVVPHGRQSFTASPGNTFFAIGSCFARNVEERLALAGATVTSTQFDLLDLGDTSARRTGIFNKYTPLSILQELEWAAGIAQYPEAALLPLSADMWYDPHLRLNSGQGSKADLMARRAQIAAYFTQAFRADIVIITLGLIETWVDLETGLSLNVLPDPKVLARNPDRFGFRCLTVEEVSATLEKIRAIFAAHGKPGQKIVLTVSPVALGRTFTQDDIIIANTTSKSVLRVAGHRFASENEGIDYYPSYEAVLHSDPVLAWQDDRLHASDFIVGHIIRTFLIRYGIAPDNPVDAALPEADPTTRIIADLRRDVDRYKNRTLVPSAAKTAVAIAPQVEIPVVIEQNVLRGGEGWLFLHSGKHTELDFLTGKKAPSQADADTFYANFESRLAYCAARGIPYQHIVFPSKPLLKGRYLPKMFRENLRSLFLSHYEEPRGKERSDHLIYPIHGLRLLEKNRSTFRKFDTHMTDEGSYIVAREALRRFDLLYDMNAVFVRKKTKFRGDLAKMIGQTETAEELVLHDKAPFMTFANNRQDLPGNTGNICVFNNTAASPSRRLLVIGDSFLFECMRFFMPAFGTALYVRSPHFQPDIAERFRPDHIITGNAERYLSSVTPDAGGKSVVEYLAEQPEYRPSAEFAQAFNTAMNPRTG